VRRVSRPRACQRSTVAKVCDRPRQGQKWQMPDAAFSPVRAHVQCGCPDGQHLARPKTISRLGRRPSLPPCRHRSCNGLKSTVSAHRAGTR
jgi:hypothetical protein